MIKTILIGDSHSLSCSYTRHEHAVVISIGGEKVALDMDALFYFKSFIDESIMEIQEVKRKNNPSFLQRITNLFRGTKTILN